MTALLLSLMQETITWPACVKVYDSNNIFTANEVSNTPLAHFTLSLCQCQSIESEVDRAKTLFLLLNHTSTYVVRQNKALLKHFLSRGTRKVKTFGSMLLPF